MIFAKLDVLFWRHEKFVKAGPAACGYYAAALARLREDSSSDGLLQTPILGLLLGVGDRKAREFCEHLVECKLFSREDGGYVLLGYGAKNETREQIEARRAATAKRVAEFRKRAGISHNDIHGNAVTNERQASVTREACNVVTNSEVTDAVTGGVTDHVTPSCNASVPGSGSDSLSVVCSDHERDPDGSTGLIPHDLPLTAEARASADMLGVQDIEGEWVKFVAHHRARESRVPRPYDLWSKWCVDARNYQRKDRERDRVRESGKMPIAAAIPTPRLSRAERKRRDAWAAEALGPSPVKLDEVMASLGPQDAPGRVSK